MRNDKNKVVDVLVILAAWLMALMLVYVVLLKFQIAFH
jgi:hypothetical protein